MLSCRKIRVFSCLFLRFSDFLSRTMLRELRSRCLGVLISFHNIGISRHSGSQNTRGLGTKLHSTRIHHSQPGRNQNRRAGPLIVAFPQIPLEFYSSRACFGTPNRRSGARLPGATFVTILLRYGCESIRSVFTCSVCQNRAIAIMRAGGSKVVG